MFWTAAHAEVQAHTFDDRKQKLTIFQMLFDYLVASLAQKLEKMEEIEIGCKIEKIWIFGKILKFSKIQIFMK